MAEGRGDRRRARPGATVGRRGGPDIHAGAGRGGGGPTRPHRRTTRRHGHREVARPREAGMIRVLVAEDHPMFRRALVCALDASGDIDVVAEASTGDTAVTAAIETSPDVVVMDLEMPHGGGVGATAEILARLPAT